MGGERRARDGARVSQAFGLDGNEIVDQEVVPLRRDERVCAGGHLKCERIPPAYTILYVAREHHLPAIHIVYLCSIYSRSGEAFCEAKILFWRVEDQMRCFFCS